MWSEEQSISYLLLSTSSGISERKQRMNEAEGDRREEILRRSFSYWLKLCLLPDDDDDDRGLEDWWSWLPVKFQNIWIHLKQNRSLLNCCTSGFRLTGGGTYVVRSSSFSSSLNEVTDWDVGSTKSTSFTYLDEFKRSWSSSDIFGKRDIVTLI